MVREFSGMSAFAWLSGHVPRDHATFLSAQITVCLGLEYLCVTAGGLCTVSARDQRNPTWKYFCRVKGQCYWTWVTTSIRKQKTLSVMRETLGSQEQRKTEPFIVTLLFQYVGFSNFASTLTINYKYWKRFFFWVDVWIFAVIKGDLLWFLYKNLLEIHH